MENEVERMQAEPAFQARLFRLLGAAQNDAQACMDSLPAAEREAIGTAERWVAKDVIAHISAWQERQGQRLEAALRDVPPPDFSGEQRLNDETFALYQHRSWDEVAVQAKWASGRLIALVLQVPVADLRNPQRFPWTSGRPLEQALVGNGYSHPQAHLADYYLAHGDLDRATTIHERMAQTLIALDDAPAYHGAALYNLACFYAVTGRPAQALAQLAPALTLAPDLRDWAKQDADLDSLRDRPDYQALFAA